MRFLKRQTINRRQIKSTTVYSDVTDSNVYINPRNSGSVVLPSGTDAQLPSGVNGMMRYNVDHDEVQVYQAGTWRSLRFKEAGKIVQQNYLGGLDGFSYFYGPLNPIYNPAKISSNNDNYGGQNILVIIENVIQIFNTNYVISQNPTAGVNTSAQANNGTSTISFATTASIPTGSVVTGSPYLQAGTVATVSSGTDVSLSLPITGGNIPLGTALTFTAPAGYYLNFTSDPNYASMIGKPITVLLGFDQ